nr:immunoglobulin heavy chain junction region [Mus musculus]
CARTYDGAQGGYFDVW